MFIRNLALNEKSGAKVTRDPAAWRQFFKNNGDLRDAPGENAGMTAGVPVAGQDESVDAAPAPVRVLFIGRSIAHLTYFESIIAALETRGADVELLFDEGWSRKLPANLGARLDELRSERPKLKTGWLVRRADKWRDFLFALRELRSYRSYITRRETTPFYVERWRNYLAPNLSTLSKKRWWRNLIKTGIADYALRAAEYLAPCDPDICKLIREKNPDILIATPANMRFSEETDYLKAARRLGVPTVVPVLSWDNLSTKGLIQQAPDMLLVWNAAQYEDAVEIHKIPYKKIQIAGAPFFDKWFEQKAEIPDRQAFCRNIGFDPERKILLYLGSSANIARDESWFIEEVSKRLKQSANPDLAGAQILIRPHPANAKVYARLVEQGYCVWPKDGALPETREDFDQMRETFFHTDAALGVNTSGMVDAVLADLPVITVRIDRYAATQSKSRHFRQLADVGALYLTEDLPEFENLLAGLFAGNDTLAARRRAFAKAFARPRGAGRAAGDVIAETVLSRVKVRRHG